LLGIAPESAKRRLFLLPQSFRGGFVFVVGVDILVGLVIRNTRA
jgi:hypothetical protein